MKEFSLHVHKLFGGGEDGAADDGGSGGVCEDPDLVYTDSCQICAVGSCCDEYEACLENDNCACWFECIGSVYDENECILQCGASRVMGELLGSPLRYRADLGQPPEGWALILLACDGGHRWQERMNLKTLHSGVFVERRDDLEDPLPAADESALRRDTL